MTLKTKLVFSCSMIMQAFVAVLIKNGRDCSLYTFYVDDQGLSQKKIGVCIWGIALNLLQISFELGFWIVQNSFVGFERIKPPLYMPMLMILPFNIFVYWTSAVWDCGCIACLMNFAKAPFQWLTDMCSAGKVQTDVLDSFFLTLNLSVNKNNGQLGFIVIVNFKISLASKTNKSFHSLTPSQN